ncbi:GNAT family N-acetyltransferase [Lentzea flava]|uniref:N-acetyltransferase domain-containing protein n=1 Tax=Lentzea flava TaxID=103732 RepID=A0ABQ2V1I4_9PSEU|nr:GNAT family N-acetyltransferase [Lentzea flava]MCP2202872.1 Acetyltransferase (GNAT) family protein [Lentzea flava]GGU62793.1 hypothetical protein GCM10010178_63590 [Lentzea flava]
MRWQQTPEGGWGRPRFVVARDGGSVVGYAHGYLPETDNAHLVVGTIVVDERWRGRGIGTALLRHSLRSANRDTAEASWIPVDGEGVRCLHGDEAAAVTVLHRTLSRPSVGHQRHTGVLAAHRGKGLGRLVKAHMLRQLTGIKIVETATSSTNEHMRRINHSLGYTDRLTTVDLSARVADLKL